MSDEVSSMDGGIYHQIGFSICSRNVLDIRKSYSILKKKDKGLIEIRLDSLRPIDSPESKARTNVFLKQIASFCSKGSIASAPSGRTRGLVDERSLPERYRYELLRKISGQGYSWIELDDEIPDAIFKEMSDQAGQKGTKIMLSSYMEDKLEWKPPSPEKIDLSQGIMVFIKVDSGPSFRRLIRTASKIRQIGKGKTKVIRTLPGSIPISRSILGLLGMDLSFIDIQGVLEENTDPGSSSPFLMEFNRRCGIEKGLRTTEWSLSKHLIGEDTDILLHLGNPIDDDISLKANNIINNRMGMDRIMIPYPCKHDTLDEELERIRFMDVKGLFVDLPFRSNMVPKLDWCDPISLTSGGVNLVSCSKGRLNGYNTEIYSISDTISATGIIDRGSSVLVLGTGLAGRAAALGASIIGMKTYLAGPGEDRVQKASEDLGNGIKGISFTGLKRSRSSFDAIINSIPFREGAFTAKQPAPEEFVRRIEPGLGIDLNRSHQWSPFLSSVESRGGRPIQGSEILIRSLTWDNRLWTGTEPDIEMLRDIVLTIM
ncbi:MAG: hypothetical protein R6V01_03130 [Thermoplasmatota archaeon]